MADQRFVLDVETDGLLREATKVHCLVLLDLDTDEALTFADKRQTKLYPDISEAFPLMRDAALLVAHNGIKFDIPVIQKFYPEFNTSARVYDTLVIAQLIFSNIKAQDFKNLYRGKFPPGLVGLHKLAAWGHRLGNLKGTYSGDWSCFNQEMADYCRRDAKVTKDLFNLLEAQPGYEEAKKTELAVAHWLTLQEQAGVKFDVDAAVTLYASLAAKREEIAQRLKDTMAPWVEACKDKGSVIVKTPARTTRYTREHLPPGVKETFIEGAPHTKVKITTFNPSSRMHIADRMQKLFGWVPEEYTPTGIPQVSDDALQGLEVPEAKLCAEYLLLEKRIAAVAEGKQAWLKLERDGFIHGEVNQLGAITHRAIHYNPNVSQVPASRAPYGEACRALFTVPAGFSLVGIDASGIQLRCLAHYMGKFDGGAYAEIVLHGDPHSEHRKAGQPFIPDRDTAKRFIYAYLFGAGDAKIGSICKSGISEEEKTAIGRKLRRKFLNNFPALKQVLDQLEFCRKKYGYLPGLDGRRVYIRSQHAALSALLQSAEAVIVKKWIGDVHFMIQNGWGLSPLPWPSLDWAKADYAPAIWNHDELQITVRTQYAESVAQSAVGLFKPLTDHFKFRCLLGGEAKIGKTWAATH